ncbi:MAG: peptide ABC transporter substrate-binding protein [Chloroflexi bacterium]|nr:peptide ABC transporter substrate-binding protein [Chloroflexota bacterium]
MKSKSKFLLLAAILILGVALVACSAETAQQVQEAAQEAAPTIQAAVEQVAPTVQAAVEEVAPTLEAAVEAVAPTAEAVATEAAAAVDAATGEFVPTSVAAENCDYGGKILSIEAVDELTVQFNLCKPDPAFLAKVAFTPFGIQPSEWIDANGGTGELLERPIGTGPYMIDSWVRGDSIIFKRFDGYWGEPAAAETAVLRWSAEGAARLLELQAGTVDMITNVSPDDIPAVEADPNLQLLTNVNPNIFYVGFNNTFAPFDNPDVRRAIAMGIDKQRIVDNFYPPGSEAAEYFTPCSIPSGCEGDPWYTFDPIAAKELLASAGFPDGFETTIYYRNVFRGYLPEPSLVAVELQTQLQENLGITANVEEMETGAFIDEATSGRLNGIHLLGWGADYPHVTNFLDFHFNANNPQFGAAHPEIYTPLEQAGQIASATEAAPLYAEANNAIRDLVPMIPIAHGASADAALASVAGAYVPPFGATQFYRLDPGKDTLIFMQNAEPISLFCADETDGESLRPCQQVVETLLDYKQDSGDTEPELATECVGNEDATVWTCTLRAGVLFHDGSKFDANDVIASWAAGIDASNPNHVGNTGSFDYFSYLWDGFMNAPSN